MLAGLGALFEGPSVDACSLLGSRAAAHTHLRPPALFLEDLQECEDGPVLLEPGAHFEKVKMLAAEQMVNITKWGSGFVPGIM